MHFARFPVLQASGAYSFESLSSSVDKLCLSLFLYVFLLVKHILRSLYL